MRFAALAAVVVASVAIGSSAGVAGTGESRAAAGTDPASDELDLPPSGRDAIAKLFDEQLRELGLRTTRASLQEGRYYDPRARGPHLAIYVEPIDQKRVSDRDAVDMIVPLARVFLPMVFSRWSDLASFDVCQEPGGEARNGTPPPITQLAVRRKAAKPIDWADASLDELVARAAKFDDDENGWGDPYRLYLFVDPAVGDVDAYRRARRSAGLPATVPTTTTTTRVPTVPTAP